MTKNQTLNLRHITLREVSRPNICIHSQHSCKFCYLFIPENIVGCTESIFEDVHEDFGTMTGILSRFEEWRENDFDAYKESYAYMCLPKCVAPLTRVQLIAWDPLRVCLHNCFK